MILRINFTDKSTVIMDKIQMIVVTTINLNYRLLNGQKKSIPRNTIKGYEYFLDNGVSI